MAKENPQHLFTPFINEASTLRAHILLDDEDQARFDSLPKNGEATVTLTDQLSGSTVTVARADCGLGCRCAAVIVGCANA